MIPVIDHFVSQSLKEFLNWRCLKDLQAFKNVTGASVTPYSPRWQGKLALGTPYGGVVYDASIPGVIVPTGLEGIPDAVMDYRNGRFIVPTGSVYTGDPLEFSVNEVNFYISSSPEARLIFETKPLQNPVRLPATGYMPENAFIAPCVFVKSFSSDSVDHALGGQVKMTWNFKIICLMRTESQLLGMQKIIRDSREDIFPLISGSLFNPYGGLTTPGWTYRDEIAVMTDYAFICDSSFKIVELDVFTDDNPKMYVGIGNMEVDYFFTPPIEGFQPYFIVDSDNDLVGDSQGDEIVGI